MEHDACGVGLIATNGKKTRKVVEYGIGIKRFGKLQ